MYELHREEGLGAETRIRRTRLENLCDTGMLQATENLRLVFESTQRDPGRPPCLEAFQGHPAPRLLRNLGLPLFRSPGPRQ